MTEEIKIRPFRITDAGLIHDSWPKGAYYGCVTPIETQKADWFVVFFHYLEARLKQPHPDIFVACLKSDPDLIIGYAAFQGSTLEWVYVKELYRRKGIAKLLLGNKVKNVNLIHLTRVGKSLLPKLNLLPSQGDPAP